MEYRLFEAGTVPEFSTQAWHNDRDRAPHLEQAGHRPRLDAAEALVRQAQRAMGLDRVNVADFGCGDGGLLSLLQPDAGIVAWGYDFTPANIAGAQERGVHARMCDFTDTREVVWPHILVMTEVLEHMADPHGLLTQACLHCRYLVASSPWNESPGDHVGYHVWAWDMDGYAAMLRAAGWRPVEHFQVGLFQLILAESQLCTAEQVAR